MKTVVYISIILLFAACNPQKRLMRLAASNPDAANKVCAALVPVRESVTVKRDTIREVRTVPGPVLRIDCDSASRVRKEQGDTARVLVYIPCPEQQIIVDKIIKDSIVYIENRAALKACEADKEKESAEKDKFRRRANANFWWAIISTVVAALLIFLKLFR